MGRFSTLFDFKLLRLIAVVALLAAACGSDGDDADVVVDLEPETSSTESDGDGQSDSGDDGAGGSASGDLEVVWPLPPGDFNVWLPYSVTEDEFQYGEFASFQTMDVTMDEVIDFYLDYFPTIGLEPNQLALGESIALNLTNPQDASWTGVMQTGVDPEGYVTVNQNYTDLLDDVETDSTTTTPPAAVSGDGLAG